MHSEFRQAYLIHRRPYRDSQLMLSVLVDGIGHLSMLARIKGKHAIKQNAHLQPFSRLLCDYAGKYDLKYLNKFELNDSPLSLTGNCLYCAFYLNELTHRIVPCNEPLESVYELYHQHLTQLQTSTDYEPILRSFEYQLLNELGFGIEFDIDADGELITPQHSYEYVAEVGFIKTQSHYSAFAGKVLLALSEGNYADESVRKPAKFLSRYLLKPLLGSKALKSRELFLPR